MCQSCVSEPNAHPPAIDGGSVAPSTEPTPESPTRVTCRSCGEEVESSSTTDTRDGRVCADCVGAEYTHCAECEEYVRTHDTSSVEVVVPGMRPRRITLCATCRAYDYVECADCSLTTRADDSVEIHDRRLCDSCASDYFTCRGCGQVFHNDDYCDEGHCQSCWDGLEEEARGPIKKYNYNVLQDLCSFGPQGTVKYGVELEVEASGENTRVALAQEVIDAIGDDFVVLKEDGSLDYGFEIVSAPAPLDIHKSRWEALFTWHDRRRKLRSYDTNTCGMHVHISRAGLTQLQIGRMLVFLHNRDNADFVEHIAQRNPERWASFAAQKKHADAMEQDGDRYVALNLRPRYTVELRIFKGTLKRESFYKNLEFAAALVAFTAPAERSLEEAGRYQEFVKFVRKNRKTYPHLDDFLVRRGYLPKRATSPQEEIALCA